MFKRQSFISIFFVLIIVLSGCSQKRPETFKDTKNQDQASEVKSSNSDTTQDLMDAILNGESEKVKTLLSKDADPNKKDDLGNTPLIISVQYGDLEITKLLLDAGADPTIQDDLGITPFAMAIENDNKEIANLLKEHGAK